MNRLATVLLLFAAACGANDTAELENRVKALEERLAAREISGQRTTEGQAAAVEQFGDDVADTWWCPIGGGGQRNLECAPYLQACMYAARADWAGCVPTRLVFCRDYDKNLGPYHCYLTSGDCTGEYDSTGNNFVVGQKPCSSWDGKSQIR